MAPEGPVLDNTELLVAELGVDDETYYRFISRGFVGQEYDNRVELLAAITATGPALAVEVDAIMRVDEDAMSAARSARLPAASNQTEAPRDR